MPYRDIVASLSKELFGLPQMMLDEAGVGITLSDPNLPDNPLVYVNRGFVDMTGYDVEESLGKNCRFLQGEQTDQDTVTQIRQAVAKREKATFEVLNYHKSGKPFWNRLTMSYIFTTEGELVYCMGVQDDVSKYKELP